LFDNCLMGLRSYLVAGALALGVAGGVSEARASDVGKRDASRYLTVDSSEDMVKLRGYSFGGEFLDDLPYSDGGERGPCPMQDSLPVLLCLIFGPPVAGGVNELLEARDQSGGL
jgi:hypothetical protein